MNATLNKRIAAALGAGATVAAVLVGCSQAEQKDALDHASSAAASATDSAKDAAKDAKDKAAEATDAAKDKAAEATDAAKDAAKDAKDKAADATDAVKDKAGDATDAVKDAVDKFDVPGVGEVKLEGPVADAFNKLGGQARLGLPTALPETVGAGTVQAFANGTIFSTPDTGAHLVQGEILKEYTANGGPAGKLGFPTSDEAQTAGGPKAANGGWISEFQNGSITWLNQGDGTFAGNVTTK